MYIKVKFKVVGFSIFVEFIRDGGSVFLRDMEKKRGPKVGYIV